MDGPRKWQVASLAAAVASLSIGGLLLARPTSEAVAPIDLDRITDSRELSLASPAGPASLPDVSPGAPQIVPPEAIEGPSPRSTSSATSIDSPDPTTSGDTTSGDTTSGDTSAPATTTPSRPAPAAPQPDDPSFDSASSVESPSSIDS